jgi:NAD(P)-dependent dehydrogenase (short-subunit alcohol dehydrogenase family)
VFLATRVDRNPIGRILTPDEVAAAIEYLALGDASAITGAVVSVDGGLTSCFEYRL